MESADTACSSNLTPSVAGKTSWRMWLQGRQRFQSLALTNKSNQDQHIPTVSARGKQCTATRASFWHFCENPKLLSKKRMNTTTKPLTQSVWESVAGLSALYKTRPKWKETALFVFNFICDAPHCISQVLYSKSLQCCTYQKNKSHFFLERQKC